MFSIKLDEIPEEGLNLTWEEPRDSLGAYIRTLSSVDFEFETPLAGEARIERIGQAYLVRGKVQARLRLSCVRCLKEFEYPILSPFQISLHPVQEGGFEEEVELAEEDMESAFFEGGELHLSEIACEQVFLERYLFESSRTPLKRFRLNTLPQMGQILSGNSLLGCAI